MAQNISAIIKKSYFSLSLSWQKYLRMGCKLNEYISNKVYD